MVKLELDTVFKLNVLALVVALISCNKQGAPDCFTAAGEKSSEYRVLESFSNLELYHEIHYTLVDTNFCGILVEGPINLIDKINAQVTQNKLVIRNNNTCNFIRSFDQDFHVTIYFSELNEVTNFSSGKIDCAAKIKGTHLMWSNKHANGKIELQVETDTLSIDSPTGVCDTYIFGTVHTAELYNDSYGHIYAGNLFSQYVYINNSALQTIEARAEKYAFVKIESSGNVILKNQPEQLDLDQQGSGILIIE